MMHAKRSEPADEEWLLIEWPEDRKPRRTTTGFSTLPADI